MSSDPTQKTIIEQKDSGAVVEAPVSETQTAPVETSPTKADSTTKTDSANKGESVNKDVFTQEDDPEWMAPPPAPLDRARGKSTPSTSGPKTGGGGSRPPPGGGRP